jgi:hypothetical protein
MGKKIRKSERKRLRNRSHRGRSDVYRFIRENLSDLQADGFGTDKGPSWDDLAETINRQKITNQRGERVTWDAVRKVFARAVRDAALEPPPPEPAAPQHRSRQRSDWQPPVSAAPRPLPAHRPHPGREEPADELPPRRSLPEPSAQAAPGEARKITYDDLPPEAKAQFERLRQDFAETDRKRFGRF